MKISADAGTDWYWNKGTQSGTGMLRYRSEMMGRRNADAGGFGFDAADV
jgi:hypothetical protein